jgi:hypothetical protein
MLRSFDWLFRKFRDNPSVPSARAKQSKQFLDHLTLDDGTDRFSRNVCKYQSKLRRDNPSVPSARAKQSEQFLDALTLEDGTDRLSRNVRYYQSTLRNIPERLRSQVTVLIATLLEYSQIGVGINVEGAWSSIVVKALRY